MSIPDKRPLARKEGLVVKEVSGELLLYDLERNKAHCLNRTAALVWQYSDGQETVASIARSVGNRLQTQIDQQVVWYALEQLGRDHLLEERLFPPPEVAGMKRRDVIRALAGAAIAAVPVVTSIVAPTPSQAATCFPLGQGCTSSAQCCSGLCVAGVCA